MLIGKGRCSPPGLHRNAALAFYLVAFSLTNRRPLRRKMLYRRFDLGACRMIGPEGGGRLIGRQLGWNVPTVPRGQGLRTMILRQLG
ncbi:MAG TPA: hypothetical protein P5114_09175 [Hyphomicrobiaceae bacterium]|nr:hypothetical protein [Hyphomicrobiaceae bacterium]